VCVKGKESPPRQLGDCLLLSNMGMNYGKERRKGEEGDGAPYIQVVGKVTSKATIYL
jgi:hypothetical protein